MKTYSLNFEKLCEASRALYSKAHDLRCVDMDENGNYMLPSSLHPTNLAAFLDQIREIIDSTDPDTILVEDPEGYLYQKSYTE